MMKLTRHKVVKVIPKTKEHVDLLQKLQINNADPNEFNIWRSSRGIGEPMHIRLAPRFFDETYKHLESHGFVLNITIDNVQRLIDGQLKNNQKRNQAATFDYGKYHTLDEVNQWINNITKVYSKFVSSFKVATSFEGRDIIALKISTSKGDKKPGFWIEGGIHSREWISPATVLYMTGQMLDQYGTDKDITEIVDMFDWYILPVFNVDGYVFTWTKNREWRKTRSKHGNCTGVDPNRNWDIHWCETGASTDPCSDLYCGPSAFSEVEVKSVADYIKNLPNVKAFIDFHSFQQLWMSPWGYTKDLPKDYKDQIEGSKLAVEALESVNGTKYQYGTIANIIYVSSGSSADWTYGKAGIVYSYGVELRDTGKYGFLLPEDQIIPSGKETLQALIALSKYVNSKLISSE